MRNKMNLSFKKTKYFNFMNEKLLIEKIKLFHDQFKTLFSGKLIASIDEVDCKKIIIIFIIFL